MAYKQHAVQTCDNGPLTPGPCAGSALGYWVKEGWDGLIIFVANFERSQVDCHGHGHGHGMFYNCLLFPLSH